MIKKPYQYIRIMNLQKSNKKLINLNHYFKHIILEKSYKIIHNSIGKKSEQNTHLRLHIIIRLYQYLYNSIETTIQIAKSWSSKDCHAYAVEQMYQFNFWICWPHLIRNWFWFEWKNVKKVYLFEIKSMITWMWCTIR